jgi:hypothetical protein
VIERATAGELNAEVSGGIASIFGAKAGSKAGVTTKIQVTPMMQALLLEEAGLQDGWLVDLSDRAGHLGDGLLRLIGDGRIFGPGEPIAPLPQFGLVSDLAHTLEAARDAQEATMRARDASHPGTFVWVASGAGASRLDRESSRCRREL